MDIKQETINFRTNVLGMDCTFHYPIGTKVWIMADHYFNRAIEPTRKLATIRHIDIRGESRKFIQYYVTIMWNGQQNEFYILPDQIRGVKKCVKKGVK